MDDADDYAEDEDYAYLEEEVPSPTARHHSPVVPVSHTDADVAPEHGLSNHVTDPSCDSVAAASSVEEPATLVEGHLAQSQPFPASHTEAGLCELHAAIARQLDLLAANAAATYDAIQKYRVSALRISDIRAHEIFLPGSRAASDQSAFFARCIAAFASELVSEVERVEAMKRAALDAELLCVDETLEAIGAIKENEGAAADPSALRNLLDGLWRSVPFFPLEPADIALRTAEGLIALAIPRRRIFAPRAIRASEVHVSGSLQGSVRAGSTVTLELTLPGDALEQPDVRAARRQALLRHVYCRPSSSITSRPSAAPVTAALPVTVRAGPDDRVTVALLAPLCDAGDALTASGTINIDIGVAGQQVFLAPHQSVAYTILYCGLTVPQEIPRVTGSPDTAVCVTARGDLFTSIRGGFACFDGDGAPVRHVKGVFDGTATLLSYDDSAEIVVGSMHSRVVCVDFASGTQRWTCELGDGAEVNGLVCLGSISLIVASANSMLRAFRVADGVESPLILDSPVLGGARVIAAHSPVVYGYSEGDSSLVAWRFYPAGASVKSEPFLYDCMVPQASPIVKKLNRIVQYSSIARDGEVDEMQAALALRRLEGGGAAAPAAPAAPGPVRDSAAAAAWADFSEDRHSRVREIQGVADIAPAVHLDTLVSQIFRAATSVCACVVVARDGATAHLVVALAGGCLALEEQTLLLTFIIPPPTGDAAAPAPPESPAMIRAALSTPEESSASDSLDSLFPTDTMPASSTVVAATLPGARDILVQVPTPAAQPPQPALAETASPSHAHGPSMPEISGGERAPTAPRHTLVCADVLQFRVASIASDPSGSAIAALVDWRSVPAARPGSIRVLPWPLRQRRAPEED